jgi:hypothetical protein
LIDDLLVGVLCLGEQPSDRLVGLAAHASVAPVAAQFARACGRGFPGIRVMGSHRRRSGPSCSTGFQLRENHTGAGFRLGADRRTNSSARSGWMLKIV